MFNVIQAREFFKGSHGTHINKEDHAVVVNRGNSNSFFGIHKLDYFISLLNHVSILHERLGEHADAALFRDEARAIASAIGMAEQEVIESKRSIRVNSLKK